MRTSTRFLGGAGRVAFRHGRTSLRRRSRITRIIPLSGLPKTSNNIIQKGLAFVREQSGSVTVSGRDALGILPRRLQGRGGAAVVAANDAASTQWRISMAKLTDTQLVILSTASRRNDRGVDLPGNVTVEAVRKAVAKLIRAGLLAADPVNGSLLTF